MSLKVFLDLDDVVFDTSKNLEKNLKKYLDSGVICSIWDKRFFDECPTDCGAFRDAYLSYYECMSDWSKIPLKELATQSVLELKDKYDLYICSEYYSEKERLSKIEVVGKLFGISGSRLILINGKEKRKYTLNMRDALLIDDNKVILENCNASKKLCFYSKYTTEDYKGIICYSWVSVLSMVRRVLSD